MQEIRIERSQNLKEKPHDESKLGFGRIFTDHMFIMDYDTGKGWHDARIVPYQPLALQPSALCLHYGQSVFEGLKAYRGEDGKVRLFRPEKNMQRLNVSNERMCIPAIDEEFAIKCINALVEMDKDWVPSSPDASLYIRPFIFGDDPFVGVRAADHYQFIIILSPVGAYYPEGLNPVKIYVEDNYVRAVRGGTGYVKAAANYAISLKAQDEAHKKQYAQVLWLDGIERKYIEEVGAMNVFFMIEDEIVTPEISGSILPGITRMSCIEMLRSWGYTVNERKVSIEELYEASQKGTLKEGFGSGTAAVISPIGELGWQDKVMLLNDGKIGEVSQRLYDTLTAIQWGKVEDTFGWTTVVK